MTTKIKYNPTPDPDNWVIKRWLETSSGIHEPRGTEFHEHDVMIGGYWDCGSFRCSDEFMQKLLVHPIIRDNCFTGVWIDELLDLEKMETPKKQQRPKHNMPYWVQDWRKK